jgi:carbon monoxide dehydrogenase subunit G
MSTSHSRFTARIAGSPETIFDLLADMPNYGRWLPGSEAFGETTEVSPYPVRLGTTYLGAGPAGKRPGSVTGYDPPNYITFHHTILLKRGPLTANIDVHVRYTLEPVERATRVIRDLDLTIQIPGLLKLAEPLVSSAFRKENVRILAELKRYVEAQPKQPDFNPALPEIERPYGNEMRNS